MDTALLNTFSHSFFLDDNTKRYYSLWLCYEKFHYSHDSTRSNCRDGVVQAWRHWVGEKALYPLKSRTKLWRASVVSRIWFGMFMIYVGFACKFFSTVYAVVFTCWKRLHFWGHVHLLYYSKLLLPFLIRACIAYTGKQQQSVIRPKFNFYSTKNTQCRK